MEKLARGLARVEEGPKGELRGGSGDGGGHGDGGGVPRRRVGWGLVLGQEKRRVRGEGASARRKGEGRGELQGLGVSVACGIEDRPRAVTRAGACAMACGVGTSSRRVGQGRSKESAMS